MAIIINSYYLNSVDVAFYTASYQYACKFMTALLHYFFLATFTWTLCEAVLVYILLVKVFGANDRKWIYLYLALGWGKLICTTVLLSYSQFQVAYLQKGI